MCQQCSAATAQILAIVLAAGASALVADNRERADKLLAQGSPLSTEDTGGMECTERAVDYAGRLASVLTDSDLSESERAEKITRLLRTDPEHRIDAEALCRLNSFCHYAEQLFGSLRNITITATKVRATVDRDHLLYDFLLGTDGQKMERARQDWHDDGDTPPQVIVVAGDPAGPLSRQPGEPQYTH